MTETTTPPTAPAPSSTDVLLQRILSRLDELESRVAGVALVAEHAQAAVVDTIDDRLNRLQAEGVDVDARLKAGAPLLERLTAPETSAALTRLLDRLDAVEQAVDLAHHAPGAVATATDIADGLLAQAQARGVDVDARARTLLGLVEQLTDPEVTAALSTLTGQLPQLAVLAQALPDGFATTVDALDDFVGNLAHQGVDVEKLLRNMVMVATRVSNVLESPEFDALMNSGVLAPKTLDVIGKAGEALQRTQQGPKPQVGLFAALKASGHPDIKRLLGFGLTFAQHFGKQLEDEPVRGSLAAKN